MYLMLCGVVQAEENCKVGGVICSICGSSDYVYYGPNPYFPDQMNIMCERCDVKFGYTANTTIFIDEPYKVRRITPNTNAYKHHLNEKMNYHKDWIPIE